MVADLSAEADEARSAAALPHILKATIVEAEVARCLLARQIGRSAGRLARLAQIIPI